MSVTDVDLEVQEILQTSTDSKAFPEKSLNSQTVLSGSPVLNSIHLNKNALVCRRRSFKNRSRARTKLADRFEYSEKKESNPHMKEFLENVIKTGDILDLNAFRKGEDDQDICRNDFKQKTSDESPNKIDDSCFKKPLSPSKCLIFSPKLKCRTVSQSTQLKNVESVCNIIDSSIGRVEFQTANVRTVQLLNSPSQIGYKNKSPNSMLYSNNNNRINYSSSCNEENSNYENTAVENTSQDPFDDLSLTQEIFDSGITNSQISNAFDNVLDNNESDLEKKNFIGFNENEIYSSWKLYNTMVDSIQNTFEDEKFFIPKIQCKRKHKLETLFLPPAKRRKDNQKYFIQKENSIPLNNVGFSTASGSKINISTKSLEKTKDLFNGLDYQDEKVNNKGFADLASMFDISEKRECRKSFGNESKQIERSNILKPVLLQTSSNITSDKQQFVKNITKNKLKFFDDLISGSETENISEGGFIKASLKPFYPTSSLHSNFHDSSSSKNIVNRNTLAGSTGFCTPKRIINQEVSSKKLQYSDEMIGAPQVNHQNNFSIPTHINNKKMLEPNSSVKRNISNQEISRNKLKYFDQLIESAENCGSNDNIPNSNQNCPRLAETLKNKGTTFPRSSSIPTTKFDEKVFQSASTVIKLPTTYEERAGSVNKVTVPSMGFSTASGRSVQVSESALKQAADIFKNIDAEFVQKVSPFPTLRTSSKPMAFKTPLKANNLATRRKKRYGGIISCKQIPISDDQLKKASLFFNEDLSSISPLRPFQTRSNNENPSFHSTPIRQNNVSSSLSLARFSSDPVTPIKQEANNSQCVLQSLKDVIKELIIEDSNVILTSPTKREGVDLIDELEQERKRLEERLKIIQDRQKMLNEMREECSKVDGRPRRGILFQNKSATKRLSVKAFVENVKPGSSTVESMLFYISPKNAVNVHFKESSVSLRTEDGAVIIPNKKDCVGLTEMSQAFNNMPGVETRLLPKGWIENHYKWIIWKLASYERMFPDKFEGALCIEKVMQQLKYRYDREIDRAERPALRRIFEKDDAPQKRMILCVSDIKQIGNEKFELELTDGWYPIRTIIDEPLCSQVLDSKIKVGTKLITCDAEIINCEGCYPLEATDLIHLKINYNSSRRAKWYAKLGYQPIPGPFPIKIRTVHELGGVIGAINICVVRCYPVKYLEKHDSYSVWLNEKAEKRRSQKWDNEQSKKIEIIQEEIRSRLSQCFNVEPSNSRKITNINDLSSITCPKELFEIMETSNDPETIEKNLSASQKQSLIEYKRGLFLKAQQEMLSQFNGDIEKVSKARRTVTSSLKLLVIDVNDNPNKSFNFYIWQPTETHLDMMTEGSCLLVYNALPRKHGELSSGTRTVFKPAGKTTNMSILFRRKITDISDINDLKFPYDFREFDTVGLVVEIKIEKSYQEVWLTNPSGRLLVVKIFEGSSTCSLLDGLKRGQPTSCCNLIYHSFRDEIVHATGNHFTVFSCYSQHKHLETGLQKFKADIPQNIDRLLEDCDEKISVYRRTKLNAISTNNSRTFNESDEDTLVSSQLSTTDIALSMIDMDKIK